MKRTSSKTSRLLVVAPVVACLALAGCGDDDDDTATTAGGVTTDAAPSTNAPAATGAPGDTAAAGESIEVEAVDYAFVGVPATVSSGTKLSLTNSSAEELHEMVVIRLPETETRSVEELVALPEEEIEVLFGSGPPAIVQLAMPGSNEPIPAVGDGTVVEPGRYAMLCFIPQGVDPQEYMDAAETATDGPPAVDGGPPHVALGMYAEFAVEG